MFFSGVAFAQSHNSQSDQSNDRYGWRETWAGVDAARDQWMFYSGVTLAPWSANIHADGLRFRFAGGYGQYAYEGMTPRAACGDATLADACSDDGRVAKRYSVAYSYAEALVGYHMRLGALTAKAFVGAAVATQRHKDTDQQYADDGTKYGAKGALEFWLNVGDDAWSSLDVSYSTARDETSARWRAGYRVVRSVSVGPELRYDKNITTGEDAWTGRAGMFLRYEWVGGEVSLASGVSTRVQEWQRDEVSPYGTLNALFQF